ncbi:M48 family metalloprotease [Lentzea aerocolonigenes]|uniref:M48 family metalloprotease n=1 Tax=Lentzea aerocolonigenes TaxID=68170 RepID=UPI000ACEDEBA|nr:M48 family metalloprotease [Lentzea aerocolonigenes]MCP2249917.1 Zn-dependent protease with chaperone function [Lentzea aerocolonigenes]
MNQEGDRSGVPTGTTLRFASLVLLAVATTLQVFGLYAALWPAATSLDDSRCQVQSGLYLTSNFEVDPDQSKWDAYRSCMATYFGGRALWLVGGLVLLFAVAALIYALRPAWLRYRRDLVPVPEELVEPLAELVAEAGLTKAPTFLIDRTNMRAGGVAFGTHRRKYVALNVGMVALRRIEPTSFRAIVLHELAHVRNDVTITYATLAIWRAFVVVVLTPYAFTWLNQLVRNFAPFQLPLFPTGWTSFTVLWHLAVLVLLVYAARVAVLRAREKHADALVVRWTGDPAPYRLLPPTGDVRRWLGHHPAPASRQAVMRDPESLLRPGFWETLGSALAVQLAWWHAVTGLQDLTWYREGNESFLVMRIVWTVPVAALIGLIAWRGAAFGPRRGTFAWPGVAIGLGLALGDVLDLRNLFPLTPHSVIAAIALGGTATLVTVWAGHCATLVRTRWHGWFLGLSIAVVTYTLLGWFPEIRVARAVWRDNLAPVVDLLHGYAQTPLNEIGLTAVVIPFLLNFNRVLTVVALALLWLVPLVLRREFPRFAALAGVIGAVPAVAAVVLLGSAGSPLVATAWQIAAVVAVQVVVVLVARLDRVAALFTAWLIGLAGTGAIWLTHLNGSQVDSVLATRPHQVLPVLGTLAALLVGGRGRQSGYTPSRPIWAAGTAVLSVAVAVWWPTAAPGAQTLQPPPARAERNTDDALKTWMNGGGQDRLMTVIQANDKVFAGVRAADPAAIAAGCEALGPVVREKFPEPPDAKVAATWTEALRALESGARSCLFVFRDRGPDDGSMTKEFLKGIEQLKVTQTALVEAAQRAIS